MSGGWGTVFSIFIWGYLVGGLTLLPAIAILAWFWSTTKLDHESLNTLHTNVALDERRRFDGSSQGKEEDAGSLSVVGLDAEILEKLKKRNHEPDTFAGYFAVCREYVPGGVNGKPPDRTTPAGAVVSMESPSVYQSMYRSIFDRNKAASPSIDAANTRNKRARNVFYVVLRLGHLMLYDNEDQLEVRHVISLAHYEMDIYAGGDSIPEGELWIKRHCIRLFQKPEGDVSANAKSFFLFSDNCSEKEDFYHAVLQAQEHHHDRSTANAPPTPMKFETPDLVKLVQQLHASEENLHTRWINALIGRIFLALYKTSEIKDFIATKITKKIARVPKPALISSVTLRSIDMGILPPFITNPKLKELTVDGDLIVEADISYKGNFRVEISAIARLELGTRFKAREVTLVLASILKRLDGHLLIRIKPPPSNRLWITFETPPRMELSVEPIVSSRQITYGVILRAIESRMREVVNETLVLPNWDDVPFTNTMAQEIRGGIWQKDKKDGEQDAQKIQQDDAALEKATIDAEKLDEKVDSISSHISTSSSIDSEKHDTGISTSTDHKESSVRPRTLRSSSSIPQVQVDSANVSAEITRDRESKTPTSVRSLPSNSPTRSPLRWEKPEPTAAVAGLSAEDVTISSLTIDGSNTSLQGTVDGTHSRLKSRELTAEDIASAAAAAAAAAAAGAHSAKKPTFNQSLNSATAAARNWLAAKQTPQLPRKVNNTNHQRNTSHDTRPLSSEDQPVDGDKTPETVPLQRPQASVAKSHTEPIGRGHPLPPPGTPLPPPIRAEKRQTWAIPAANTFANIAKRKPVSTASSPTVPEMRGNDHLHSPGSSSSASHSQAQPSESQDAKSDYTHMPRRKPTIATEETRQVARRMSSSTASSTTSIAPPPLPKRRQRQPSLNLNSTQFGRNSQISQGGEARADDMEEGLLVVEVPRSASSSSVDEEDMGGGRNGMEADDGRRQVPLRGMID